jgi:hypothetical protein
MSFHEKSAWVCLVSIGLVYIPYFGVVLRLPMAALGLFWVATAGLVALLTIFHLANAIATRSIRATGDVPPLDELDQRIELRAAKWSGFTLACAVITWVLIAMYSMPVIGGEAYEQAKATGIQVSPASFSIPVLTAMLAVHWLFVGFVLANIAYYGGIVFGYRRLAGA